MSNPKSTVELLAYEETLSCVQCGYCLPACPTYKTMKKETQSPRGRINLVKMAAEGKLSIDKLQEPIDLCLGCRACETACPTNVQYGSILESAKEAIQQEKNKTMDLKTKLFRKSLFNYTFPNKRMLQGIGAGMTVYQASGLQKLTHKTGIIKKVLPEHMAEFDLIVPKQPALFARKKRPIKHLSEKKPVLSIGFFSGCVMDAVFSKINDLSIKLLQKAGCDVTVIKEQTCCGALHSHSGEMDHAKELAKKNIEAYEKYSFDYIVNSIGGCGAMLVEYDHLLKNDPKWAERAKEFSKKAVDISVILSQLQLPFTHKVDRIVTYQPSCHMTNVQKTVKEPKDLLRSIPGIRFVELQDENMCCGSAGIYNLVNYQESMEILDQKMVNVKRVKPDMIVTTNPGCHLQMKLGVKREQMSDAVEVVHLVELLANACEIE
ncbi:(Fe-S)-binding protein [Bacillus sp. Marseille-P3661]|uniref:(Fe-S)-binding protein n=1 Tax=Bacillus sp. Marseille-P3661 TaxID=1936234 RepID=UPI000C837417|nr:(Fe-S)-binding protein [Bacillus sp. Marseille-P3661]